MVSKVRLIAVLLCWVSGNSLSAGRPEVGSLASMLLSGGRFFKMAGSAREPFSRHESVRGMFATERRIIREAYAEARERAEWMKKSHFEQFVAMEQSLEAEERAALARVDREEQDASGFDAEKD